MNDPIYNSDLVKEQNHCIDTIKELLTKKQVGIGIFLADYGHLHYFYEKLLHNEYSSAMYFISSKDSALRDMVPRKIWDWYIEMVKNEIAKNRSK
jgi:hypothetical protein